MSFREMLLTQKEPLDAHDAGILREWLRVLKGDVEMFGETAADVERIKAIEARLAEEPANV